MYIWLVVWNIFCFSIYWEFHHPNWLSYFSDGIKPPTRSLYHRYSIDIIMIINRLPIVFHRDTWVPWGETVWPVGGTSPACWRADLVVKPQWFVYVLYTYYKHIQTHLQTYIVYVLSTICKHIQTCLQTYILYLSLFTICKTYTYACYNTLHNIAKHCTPLPYIA